MSFFERLKEATIGFSGYPRLIREPRGAFGYMALLLAIVVVINGYMNLVELRQVSGDMARQMATWPEFGVRNGQFYFEGPMPFQKRLDDGILLVVDTTGQTTPAALSGQKAFLVTGSAYHVIQPGMPPREFSFAMLTTDLTREDLQTFLVDQIDGLLWFVYLFIYLFQLAFKALDAAILALIAMLYGRLAGRQVSFQLGFKLGLYAMSLPIIIQWIWRGFHTWTTMGFTIWWSVATIYLIFGLRAYWDSERAEGPLQG